VYKIALESGPLCLNLGFRYQGVFVTLALNFGAANPSWTVLWTMELL